ncbi:MAG: hypothetical protein AB1793_04225 [Candidatus Thermoplasmatota archaeon]
MLSGFILMYCRGARQGRCLRKHVGKELGSSEMVPANMLPNGLPVTGTDDRLWPAEVKRAVGRRK